MVATVGNRSQIGWPQKPQKQAKTVAAGCDRLPFGAHGKEGVSGSSPEEGSGKTPPIGAFRVPLISGERERDVGMEPFMEPSGQTARGRM